MSRYMNLIMLALTVVGWFGWCLCMMYIWAAACPPSFLIYLPVVGLAAAAYATSRSINRWQAITTVSLIGAITAEVLYLMHCGLF